MAQLSPLQKYEAKDYKGLVTDNHFYSLYQQKPELISTVIKEIKKMVSTTGCYKDKLIKTYH